MRRVSGEEVDLVNRLGALPHEPCARILKPVQECDLVLGIANYLRSLFLKHLRFEKYEFQVAGCHIESDARWSAAMAECRARDFLYAGSADE